MQVLKVKELVPHPKNEYFFDEMTGQKYNEFRESIRTSGVIEPLIVTQDMVIVSGHQRRRGCIDEGIEEVLCEIRHYADRDGRSKEDWILKDLIETNVRQRGEIGGSELKAIHRVDELRRIYGAQNGGNHGGRYIGGKSPLTTSWDNVPTDLSPQTTGEVCAAAGIDYESYRKFKSLADLNPDWQELLEAGNVSASVAARIIAKLPADKQADLLESLPADAKQRLTANEAKRYIGILEQQQKEHDEQTAELTKKLNKEHEELSKIYEEKAQKVLEQEDVIRALRAKRDPEHIAAINKLYEQNEKDLQLARSLQRDKCRLEAQNTALQQQIDRLKNKCDEANNDVGDLMSEKDAIQDELDALKAAQADMEKEIYDRISTQKDREITELRRKLQDLQAVEKEISKPNVVQYDTPYSMPTLLRYLPDISEQIKHYALSEALNVNSKNGDIDTVCNFVREMQGNLNTIISKLKGVA